MNEFIKQPVYDGSILIGQVKCSRPRRGLVLLCVFKFLREQPAPLHNSRQVVPTVDRWEIPSDIEELEQDETTGDALAKAAAHPLPPPPPLGGTASSSGSGAPPLPPPPPRPPIDRGPRGDAAKPGERQFHWGPFTISVVVRGGDVTGYGGNCNRHRDPGSTLRCTKPMTFGKSELTDGDVIAKLKHWLILGLDIPAGHPLPRKAHVLDMDARRLLVLPDDELDNMLRARGFEP
jgi:hypothetical protein